MEHRTEGRRVSRAFLKVPGSDNALKMLRALNRMVMQAVSLPPYPSLEEGGTTALIACDASGSCHHIEQVLATNYVRWTTTGSDNLTLKVELTLPLGAVKRFTDARVIETVLGNKDYFTEDGITRSTVEAASRRRAWLPKLTTEVENPKGDFDPEIFQNQVRVIAAKSGVRAVIWNRLTAGFALNLRVSGSCVDIDNLFGVYGRLGFVLRTSAKKKEDALDRLFYFHRQHPNVLAVKEFLGDWKPLEDGRSFRRPKIDKAGWRKRRILAHCKRAHIAFEVLNDDGCLVVRLLSEDPLRRKEVMAGLRGANFNFSLDPNSNRVLNFHLPE